MSIPILKQKINNESVTSPTKYLKYCKRFDREKKNYNIDGIILTYSKRAIDETVKKYVAEKIKSSYGNYFIIQKQNKRIGVLSNFGIGASHTVDIVEELIAYGCKRFITIGMAGAISKEVNIGDIIICNKAIRDEGTSYHYLAPSKYAYCDKGFFKELLTWFDNSKIKYLIGPTWTTDAPYRETELEILSYQRDGVLTVDMEASALYALSKYRRVKICSIFVISDKLSNLVWEPCFRNKKINQNIEIVLEGAIEFLCYSLLLGGVYSLFISSFSV